MRKQTLRSLSFLLVWHWLFENMIYDVSRVKFWKVGVMPKGRAHPTFGMTTTKTLRSIISWRVSSVQWFKVWSHHLNSTIDVTQNWMCCDKGRAFTSNFRAIGFCSPVGIPSSLLPRPNPFTTSPFAKCGNIEERILLQVIKCHFLYKATQGIFWNYETQKKAHFVILEVNQWHMMAKV